MSTRRQRLKGRCESGSFVAMPRAVFFSENWKRCSGTAIKMLIELAEQFKGSNNGDLSAPMVTLKRRGWSSPETVTWALRELRHFGLIVLTRQGGMNVCSLYAVTWRAIDECGGKLDCRATRTPGSEWKLPREPFKRPVKVRKATTPNVASNYGIRSDRAKDTAS